MRVGLYCRLKKGIEYMRYYAVCLVAFFCIDVFAQLEFVGSEQSIQKNDYKTECDDLSSSLSFQICTFELLEQIKVRNNELNEAPFKIQNKSSISGQRLEALEQLDFSKISTYDFLTASEMHIQYLSNDSDSNLIPLRFRYYGILNQILNSLNQISQGENDIVVITQNRARQAIGGLLGEPTEALVPVELRKGQEALKEALRNFQRFQKDLVDYANSK